MYYRLTSIFGTPGINSRFVCFILYSYNSILYFTAFNFEVNHISEFVSIVHSSLSARLSVIVFINYLLHSVETENERIEFLALNIGVLGLNTIFTQVVLWIHNCVIRVFHG